VLLEENCGISLVGSENSGHLKRQKVIRPKDEFVGLTRNHLGKTVSVGNAVGAFDGGPVVLHNLDNACSCQSLTEDRTDFIRVCKVLE